MKKLSSLLLVSGIALAHVSVVFAGSEISQPRMPYILDLRSGLGLCLKRVIEEQVPQDHGKITGFTPWDIYASDLDVLQYLYKTDGRTDAGEAKVFSLRLIKTQGEWNFNNAEDGSGVAASCEAIRSTGQLIELSSDKGIDLEIDLTRCADAFARP